MSRNSPKSTPYTREDLAALGYETQGNCFEIHAKSLHQEPEGTVLVHGLVDHGEFPHIRHPHAWLEQEVVFPDGVQLRMVRDISNGNNIEVPAQLYYLMGRVIDASGQVARYTAMEMTRKLLANKHYGPWDLDPSI